ncbi:MAG: TonB family protein, partial [Myxococcales bacterium]|nr:TonB family protein [Myxococcales bacterium]
TAAGQAPPPAQPASIATIKTRAKPRGGQDYINLRQDYPEEARQLGIAGQIKVRLVIDATGTVTQRKLLTRLGHGLDELAMRYAARLTFEPARDSDDRAVASVEVWTFTFTLPD